MVRNRAASGFSGSHSLRRTRYDVFSDHGGTGRNFFYLPAFRLYELFYYVYQYIHEIDESVLSPGSTGTWNYVCGAGISDGRRRHEIDPPDGGDAALGKLWRKFSTEYSDHVCHCSGTVYAQAG